MTLLFVQQFSHPSTSAGSSGGGAGLLELAVLFIVVITAVLFVRDWRQLHPNDGATLVNEAERWLRNQSPGG